MKKKLAVLALALVGIVSMSLLSCEKEDEHYGYKYLGKYDTMKECYAAAEDAGFHGAKLEGRDCYAQ